MKKIVIASSNKHKLEEFTKMLAPLGYEVLGLNDLDQKIEIIEDGTTFSENALIKVRSVYEALHIPVISDDSGITCDCLDGGPGIYSARFMGEDTPYTIKNNHLIEKANETGKRGCAYVCVIAYKDEAGNEQVFEGVVSGEIHSCEAGSNGFGYDPIFYYPPLQATWAQVSMEEKNKVSHRARALAQFIAYLKGE